MTESTSLGATDGTSVTLSTGHEVTLPLRTEATATGAMFSADRDAVRELLPDGLTPIQVARGRAAATFLCVEYHRIGRDGTFEPYNEFGVLFPAVDSSRSIPYVSVLRHGLGGYVWYLPVTNEPGKALGVEVWGYPKVVSEITHEDLGSARRTAVSVDGEKVIDLTIRRPPSVGWTAGGPTYTIKDETMLSARLEFSGDVGAWPCSGAVSCTLGEHPRAERLRDLDLGERALARVAADGECTIHAGHPLASE
jgi:hypothetical protein